MRILFVCHRIPSPFLASSTRTFHFIKHLSIKYKHTITLVALNGKNEKISVIDDLKDHCELVEIFERPRIELSYRTFTHTIACVREIVSGIQPAFLISSSFSSEMRKRVRELLEKERFDMTYADDLSVTFYLFNIDLPRIVDIKDATLGTRENWFNLEKNPLRRLSLRLQMPFLWRRERRVSNESFDRWIMVSDDDRDEIKSYFPDLKVSVIPNGVDTNYFKPEDRVAKSPNIVFVGNMSSLSNVSGILFFYHEIFPLIKKEIPKVRLFIVGKNPRKPIYRLASDKSVCITGWVNDIRPYLADASVFIAPTLHNTGMMNKILEAMAMGKPVISTSLGVHGIKVSPEKNVIIADNPQEFAMRVVELISNDKLGQRIGRNAREHVKDMYLWEKSTDKLNSVLEGVAQGE